MLNEKLRQMLKERSPMSRIIVLLYGFITISLGSSPGDGPFSPGGLLVIGIYDQKPKIQNRLSDTGVLLTIFEY